MSKESSNKVPKEDKKKQSKPKKERVKKALKLIGEINDYLDKTFVNKDITLPLPMKSAELKPFKK